jgi:D-alanyl-D-alanine endopeptidase (penicillin-binding protein 7)
MIRRLVVLFLFFCTQAVAAPLTAKSWLVTDGDGNFIAGENMFDVRSIASVTKLMTVVTILDSKLELDSPLNIKLTTYNKKNRKVKSSPYDNTTRRQLIDLAMVRSDNNAARLLCTTYPTGYDGCVRDMNIKARSLGMINSVFYDPTGLDDRNNSTAKDLVLLVQSGHLHPEVVSASQKSKIQIKIKKRWFLGKNTNPLIGTKHDIQVSKTGWTTRAGGCIVMLMDTDRGRRIVIVLGSRSIKTRIPEAEFISTIEGSPEEKLQQQEPSNLWRRWF